MDKVRAFALFCLLITALNIFPNCAESAEKNAKEIYIAPDLGTFLYAISMWDADKIFPVFMDKDDRYTQKFAEAYADGGKIKYIELPKHRVGRITQNLAYKTLYAAWGPETLDDLKKKKIGREEIKQRLAALKHVPEGIVITNIKDAEFAGGIALAAGHKQILDFYKPRFKLIRELELAKTHISESEKEKIRNEVIDIIKSWKYPYRDLGKGIDYITLALDIAHAYQIGNNYLSLDDAINRITPYGMAKTAKIGNRTLKYHDCYAYVGRLLEASPHAALYQGMCPLFLPIDSAYFADGWGGPMSENCKKAVEIMSFKTTTAFSSAHITDWKKHMKEKSEFGFIRVNAKGGPFEWNGKGVDDFVECSPVVVYFAHSHSACNPSLTNTIAGRWLLNGAFIYYGSIHEPYASSFNIPVNVAINMIVNKFPLGKAFQFKMTLPGRMSKPWKLIYIGDPLYRPKYRKKTSKKVTEKKVLPVRTTHMEKP